MVDWVSLGTANGGNGWLCVLPLAEVVLEVDLVLVDEGVDAIGKHVLTKLSKYYKLIESFLLVYI